MNLELFIAKRIIKEKNLDSKLSKPIITIATTGIILSLAVMILSVAIATGYKTQISEKIIGFGSHIQIINYDSNLSFETNPISKDQFFLDELSEIEGVKHIQSFSTKAGIIKNDNDIQGIVLKGVSDDFDWNFFEKNMIEGVPFEINDSVKSNKIVISKYVADLLTLKVGDKITTYFIQQPPRIRRFEICGIYETSLAEFDEKFALIDNGQIQSLNDWTSNQVSGIEIIIDDYNEIEYMSYVINSVVGYNFSPDGSKLRVQNIKQKYPQIFDWLNLTDTNVWIILALMVIVAGINMMTGLIITILERVNMIGILKALGTKNWNLRKVFLYQATYLIAKGLFWGNIFGLGIAFLQKKFEIIHLNPDTYYLDTVPIHLSLSHIVMLNIGTLCITILMLIIPSYVVSRISPEKTIRFN